MSTHTDNISPFQLPRAALCAALIILATLIAYRPALDAGYIWDDDNYVTNNKTLDEPGGLRAIWLQPRATPQYYPLVHTSFWLEYRLWKLDPAGYHAVNILLHTINALLLWLVLRHLRIPGAWIAALLFACHPVHVESVAWVTERKNVLSGMFTLGALLSFLQLALPHPEHNRARTSTAALYMLSLLLFVCALLSKTVACTLPVVVAILYWWRQGAIPGKMLGLLVPFLAVGFTMGMLTVRLEQTAVGASGPEWDYNIVERCMIAGRALWFYIGKLCWPSELSFIYPRWDIAANHLRDLAFPVGFGLLLLCLFGARQRIGRGPLAMLMVYAVTLFPALGFFNVYPMRYSFVADHFQYLASIPILTGAAWMLVRAGAAAGLSRLDRTAIPFMITATLAVMTWFRCHAFLDEKGLWLDTLRKNPNAWIACNNLGLLHMGDGLIEQALPLFRRAIELKPDHARAYNNLAMALERSGNTAQAAANYETSLRLDVDDRQVLNNYASFLARSGKFTQATAVYEKALAINPYAADVLMNLGNLCASQGNWTAARDYFSRSIAIDPGNPETHYNLANLLVRAEEPEKSLEQLTIAIRLRPKFVAAHELAALVETGRGRDQKALEHLATVVRLAPGNAIAHFRIGFLLQRHEQLDAAATHYATAVRLQPDLAEGHNNLGAVYEMQGKLQQALASYRQAVFLKQQYPEANENLQRVARIIQATSGTAEEGQETGAQKIP